MRLRHKDMIGPRRPALKGLSGRPPSGRTPPRCAGRQDAYGRMMKPSAILAGAAAGAAGTTALNALTYVDMAVRGRPASSTPEKTVEKASDLTGVPVPGDDSAHDNRVSGLGALTGIATGVAVGACVGALHAGRRRPGGLVTAAAASGAALVAANAPMTAMGITDPRSWSASSWVSDVVPHLGYGAVTAYVLRAMTR